MAETVELKIDVAGDAQADMQKLAAALAQAAETQRQYGEAVKNAANYKVQAMQFDHAVQQQVDALSGNIIEPASKKKKKKQFELGKATASAAGGAQTLAGGGGAMALIGKAGPWGMAAAAAYAALEAGLNKTAKAADISSNGMLTQAQKSEMLASEFIPLYASFKRFGEAMDGTTEALRAQKLKLERTLAIQAATAQTAAGIRAFEYSHSDQYRAQLRSFGEVVPLRGMDVPLFDRSTSAGAQAAHEASIRGAAADAQRQAKRAAVAAREGAYIQSGEAKTAIGKRNYAALDLEMALKKVQNLREQENNGGERNKKAIGAALADAHAAAQRFDFADSAAQTEINRSAEATKRSVEAESNARRANLEVMKAELAIQEQKEQRMAGFAEKLGAMSEGDFQERVAALEAVKGVKDLREVPVELQDLASGIAGGYIKQRREQAGEGRGAYLKEKFGDLNDAAINDFGKETLAQVRANTDAMRIDARVQIDFDAELTAKALAEQLAPILGQLKNAATITIREAENKKKLEQIERTAGEG